MFYPYFRIPITKRYKALLITALHISIIFIAIQIAKHLKHKSIAALYSKTEVYTTFDSMFKIEKGLMNKVIADINKHEEVQQLLNKHPVNVEKPIGYILSVDMSISEIPMITPQDETCHLYKSDYSANYKLVYTKAKFSNNAIKDKQDVLFNTTQLFPLLEVWYDISMDKITKIIEPFVAEVSVGTALIEIDQTYLETVVPKIGHKVMLLYGKKAG